MPPHFMFGRPVAAFIQYAFYLERVTPPCIFWPPLLRNPGDRPGNATERFSFCRIVCFTFTRIL